VRSSLCGSLVKATLVVDARHQWGRQSASNPRNVAVRFPELAR